MELEMSTVAFSFEIYISMLACCALLLLRSHFGSEEIIGINKHRKQSTKHYPAHLNIVGQVPEMKHQPCMEDGVLINDLQSSVRRGNNNMGNVQHCRIPYGNQVLSKLKREVLFERSEEV